MSEFVIAMFAIVGTIISYSIGRFVYRRFYTPFLLPITVATIIIVVVLLVGNVSYDTYMLGGKWIHSFLGPAVVALAYPLYQHRDLLRRYAVPILFGNFVGAFVGIVSGLLLAKLADIEGRLLYSLLPKSVTTPVAMEISEAIGGISSLSAVLVIIAGLTGAMLGPFMFRIFRIRSEIGRGTSFGAASHAIGTAAAFENGQLEGSVSTISMILSAVFTSLLTPLIL